MRRAQDGRVAQPRRDGALESDTGRSGAGGAGRRRAVQPELGGALLERGDDDRDVLVEVDAEQLRAGVTSSRFTAAAKLGCLSFFFTDFGVRPWMPCGRTYAQARTKPESSSTA